MKSKLLWLLDLLHWVSSQMIYILLFIHCILPCAFTYLLCTEQDPSWIRPQGKRPQNKKARKKDHSAEKDHIENVGKKATVTLFDRSFVYWEFWKLGKVELETRTEIIRLKMRYNRKKIVHFSVNFSTYIAVLPNVVFI